MWSGGGGISGSVARAVLLPGEWLFRAALRVRALRYRAGTASVARASIPVISVGNLSVGGTGKTPVASWVIRVLRDRGARPALVARGYGEDELLLHGRWTPGIPVVADPDRAAGVEQAAGNGASVAVLDDGFQHRRLAREVDLVLVAAEEGVPGRLLPRGPFREPLEALGRAHGVLVTRKSASLEAAREVAGRIRAHVPGAVVGVAHLRPAGLRPLGVVRDPGESELIEGPVVVATGVARPESVAAGVRALGLEVAALKAFPDHHDFREAEVTSVVQEAAGRPVVVTEKDAVKWELLEATRGAPVQVLYQELTWEEGEAAMEELLMGALAGRME